MMSGWASPMTSDSRSTRRRRSTTRSGRHTQLTCSTRSSSCCRRTRTWLMSAQERARRRGTSSLVEPRSTPSRVGPAMAAELRSNLPSGRLQISLGGFETMPIAPASADAVFSATAYQWVSAEARLDRPAAILRPGGIVAIVDLVQVDSPDDRGLFAAAQPIYERYGERHTRRSPSSPTRAAASEKRQEALRGLRGSIGHSRCTRDLFVLACAGRRTRRAISSSPATCSS